MHPVLVYLDSSDFSVLSNPNCLTDELSLVLKQLRHWVGNGQVVCCFSGTHLSEMAPVDGAYADSAQSRARLLVELCGRNALISQNRLFAGELQYALGEIDVLPDVHSPIGNWYPDGVQLVLPVGQVEIAAEIQDVIQSSGMSRKERRAAERRTLKAGKPRPGIQATLLANARNGALDEILDRFPMRPEDARVLSRYVAGDATAQEATAALEESLRDPRWMMQWLGSHQRLRSEFISWVRGPAASMQAHLNDMVNQSASVHQMDEKLGTGLAESLFSSPKWVALQDKLLYRIGMRISKEYLNHDASELTVAAIDKSCPGLSVGIRSLHTAWRTTTGRQPRMPKLSDFPDGLHAMYAPYVDLFRADSFMAPHIAKAAGRFGTNVVSKLALLPCAIQEKLLTRAKVA